MSLINVNKRLNNTHFHSQQSSFDSSILDNGEYSKLIKSLNDSFSPSNDYNSGLSKTSRVLNINSLVKMAKDSGGDGNRKLQQRMNNDEKFRNDVLKLIFRGGEELLLQLSIDSNACYVILVYLFLRV